MKAKVKFDLKTYLSNGTIKTSRVRNGITSNSVKKGLNRYNQSNSWQTMASRWRKTTMCYESVPIEEERTQQFKELPNPEQSIQSLDQCNQQSEYLTYDTAPTVNRVLEALHLAHLWTDQLPGGLERLSCTMMAIFLFLSIITVQLYIHALQSNGIRSQTPLCSEPSTITEAVTFECRVKLYVIAWIVSMISAWLVLFCHFLYWCVTQYRIMIKSNVTNVSNDAGDEVKQSTEKRVLHSIVTDECLKTIDKEYKKDN